MTSAPDPVAAVAQLICSEKQYQLDIASPAAGAFKRTYRVLERGNALALKIVAGHVDARRVQREIEALTRCDHQNVVRLFETGVVTHDGRDWVYFLEEFLAGGTLSDRLLAGRALNVDEGRALAIPLAQAIQHLAERQLVHRDIKPDNIMFRDTGEPVLVDLGIARHLEATPLTADGVMGPGTPAYAAPEQLLGERDFIDWRCDQYSLGVVLSQAIFGMHPASGGALLAHDVPDITRRRQPPADAFVQAAGAAGLTALIRMVQPWPVQRFTRPELLVNAWRS